MLFNDVVLLQNLIIRFLTKYTYRLCIIFCYRESQRVRNSFWLAAILYLKKLYYCTKFNISLGTANVFKLHELVLIDFYPNQGLFAFPAYQIVCHPESIILG